MHQREIKKLFGPMGCVFEYQSKRAVLRRGQRYFHVLTETTKPNRQEEFFCNPGFAAHGRVVSILTKWWG